MPQLLKAVEMPDKSVSLLISLPRSYRAALSNLAHTAKRSVSDLLQSFIEWGWEGFARGHLVEAMSLFRHYSCFWNLSGLPGEDVPGWLRSLIEAGEQRVVFIPHVRLRHWSLLAPALHRLEGEFYDASLSDAMTLFFAWGWARFDRWLDREGCCDE